MPNPGYRKDWETVTLEDRIKYAMKKLVVDYKFPVNGAAGLVGNLIAESGVIPSRIEGSKEATPMTAKDFAGAKQTFTPQQIMDRNYAKKTGPRLPGAGLAQWTAGARRKGLFTHTFGKHTGGAEVLYDMDTQLDYLVTELKSKYPGVNKTLTNSAVTLEDASDDVVYRFEVPGSVIGSDGKKLPRTDENVQKEFKKRRTYGRRVLTVYPNP